MYGEWLYAKHTVYYDALPHYFMEFDVLDRETGSFLDTAGRRALLAGLPVSSAAVLAEGVFHHPAELLRLLGNSRYITEDHLASLRAAAEAEGLDPERVLRETDPGRTMEGLYLKVEEDGRVVRRLKYVRSSFRQTVESSRTHWLERPIVPNGLSVETSSLFIPGEGSA